MKKSNAFFCYILHLQTFFIENFKAAYILNLIWVGFLGICFEEGGGGGGGGGVNPPPPPV